MAGFDTSNVASQVNSAPLDVGKTLGGLANVQNAFNENKMFQARTLAGQYLEQSKGPDGQPDPGKFGQLLRADPRTAPYASVAEQEMQAIRSAGVTTQTNLQALQANRYKTLQSLLAQTTSDSEYLDVIKSAKKNGLIDDAMAANMSGGNVPGTDLASIRANRNQAVLGQGNAPELRANIGEPDFVSVGNKVQPVLTKVGPDGASVSAVGGNADLTTGLTPGEVNLPAYQRYNPETKQMETITKGQAATSPPSGPIPSAPPLGVAEAASQFSSGSASQYAGELADQPNATRQITALKQIDQLLQTPEGRTGPGTQVTSGWRNFILGNAPMFAKIIPGGVNEAILQSATQDELKKYMIQASAAAASQYGQDTNFKLATAAAGNPNVDMSNLGNQDVTRMNIALRRADQARLAAFQATNRGPEDYSTFASQWSRSVDPRAFMLDLLSKDQRTTLLQSITTDAGKQALLQGKHAAEQAGLFKESDIPK